MSDEVTLNVSDGDDEVMFEPVSPEEAASSGSDDVEVEGSFDGGDLAGVPKFGDVIPQGTYSFRLDSHTVGEDDPMEGEEEFGNQPSFNTMFKCQSEPHVGRTFFDFLQWVNKQTFIAARGTGPKANAARTIINRRLSRIRTVMEVTGYDTKTGGDVVAWLNSNPELKIQLSVKDRKSKDDNGKWKPTGEKINRAVRYLPPYRPA